ncbi:MAG: hybrid sensor histidine kinase/response regulator [Gammaproteobacteria bacterium]|nr:hybrid sensor histidine kinase/response regulator [Gammaproteobacteria bacterium]
MGINKQPTILTVDDNPSNLQLLDGFLAGGDYNILKAENGEEALKVSRNNSIDLVLLDIMMPGMDGYQVCETLKKMPDKADVPVIFLTARNDIESMIKGFNVGAVDYLTKPINVEEFRARVSTHLRLRHQEQELKQHVAAKNRFVSIIADDLRTPIEALKSVLKMLNDSSEELDKVLLHDYISMAYSAADCLDAISQNLTKWSALQNNELPANPQVIAVYTVFNEIVDEIQQENKQKGIIINNNIEHDQMAFVDDEYLRIIARNILSNAVSFSQKESQIDIFTECSNVDGSLTIVVKDQGVGMSPEEMENIFQVGEQHRGVGTAGEIGTGMGLVLCRDLLVNSNGRIWLESEQSKGTKVYINLPQGK